jgi:hypothetical protein
MLFYWQMGDCLRAEQRKPHLYGEQVLSMFNDFLKASDLPATDFRSAAAPEPSGAAFERRA